MRVPADDLPFSERDLRAAVAAREVPALVAQFVGEGRWRALRALFGQAGAPESATSLPLVELEGAARALAVALDALPPPRAARALEADEVRGLRLAAAEALLARSGTPPFGTAERRLRARAAKLLAAADDHARAATVREELGDDAGAAEAWGALGELERMEAAHARDEARAGARRAATDGVRRFDVLHTGGERRLAIAEAAALPVGLEEAAATRELAARLDARLVRARAVTLRVRGVGEVRVAALPARLGRDPLAELTLRDPGVSRVHAVLRADGDAFVVEDLGSRGGLRVGGARATGPFALGGDTVLELGATTALRLAPQAGSHVIVRGAAGLDRALVALVGHDPLDLALVIPGADGLALELAGGAARLVRRPDVPVRVAGHFLGAGCDLLHGDVIELPPPRGLVLEVA
jgi:Inner membrane component of T3SS, cytoplasmic domain